jgi:CelD/BcsL family acetyltransferase involved in cellulose biosynthesis
VKNFLRRPGTREFFRDVVTDPAMGDVIHMGKLEVGSTIAAASIGLRWGDTYSLVLSSYLDSELSRLGPGRAHLRELLRYAIDEGFAWFDFTVGDEPYKRDWSDKELKLFDHLAAVTIRGRLVLAPVMAFRRAKRFIKRTPLLWHAYSTIRSSRDARYLGTRAAAERE